MNMRVLYFGLITTFIGLFALVYLIAAVNSFLSLSGQKKLYLIPGLVFSVVWGAGVAASAAYFSSALVFVTVAAVCWRIWLCGSVAYLLTTLTLPVASLTMWLSCV